MENERIEKTEKITSRVIFLVLTFIILFIESLIIILSSISKGFIKKEKFSYKSNTGVDLKIIMK